MQILVNGADDRQLTHATAARKHFIFATVLYTREFLSLTLMFTSRLILMPTDNCDLTAATICCDVASGCL